MKKVKSEISGLQIGSEADEEGESEISGLQIGSEADEEGESEISGLQIGSEADEIFRTHQRWEHH